MPANLPVSCEPRTLVVRHGLHNNDSVERVSRSAHDSAYEKFFATESVGAVLVSLQYFSGNLLAGSGNLSGSRRALRTASRRNGRHRQYRAHSHLRVRSGGCPRARGYTSTEYRFRNSGIRIVRDPWIATSTGKMSRLLSFGRYGGTRLRRYLGLAGLRRIPGGGPRSE